MCIAICSRLFRSRSFHFSIIYARTGIELRECVDSRMCVHAFFLVLLSMSSIFGDRTLALRVCVWTPYFVGNEEAF